MHIEERAEPDAEDGEKGKRYTELICYNVKSDGGRSCVCVGHGSDDHVYIMDHGATVDHLVFCNLNDNK